MISFKNIISILTLVLISQSINSQEGLPIYSDYLTDNFYLLHPSMAGVSNCNKLRVTGRQQWFGNDDAPSLQTMSVNGRIGESASGVGAIVSLFSFAYGSSILINAFLGQIPVPGFASIATLITFLLGLIILMLGMIGEYLWRIFDELNKRPEVVIDKIY